MFDSREKKNIIVSIDVGNSGVKLVFCEQRDDEVAIVYAGEEKYEGLALRTIVRGKIQRVDKIKETIQKVFDKSVEEIDFRARFISFIYTLNGIYLESNYVRESRRFGSVKHGAEVHKEDLDALSEKLSEIEPPEGKELIHNMHRMYLGDHGKSIPNPVGNIKRKVDVEHLIVMGDEADVLNVNGVVQAVIGTPPDLAVSSAVANGLYAMKPDEKELGALVLDIGAGVTTFNVYEHGNCLYVGQVGVGCLQAVNDICQAFGFGKKLVYGEELLHKAVDLAADNELESSEYELSASDDFSGTRISKTKLNKVVRARFDELMQLVNHELKNHNLERSFGNKIIITGGGSNIVGMQALVKSHFNNRNVERVQSHNMIWDLSEGCSNESSRAAYSAACGCVLYYLGDSDNVASLPWSQSVFDDARSLFSGLIKFFGNLFKSFKW